MKDLRFEQKTSLSRLEAADQLAALAAALREGGEADIELGPVTLTMRIPDELSSEFEVEVGDGEIELEIELRWPMTAPEAPRSPAGRGGAAKRAAARKS